LNRDRRLKLLVNPTGGAGAATLTIEDVSKQCALSIFIDALEGEKGFLSEQSMGGNPLFSPHATEQNSEIKIVGFS
jgi:hypothetical protein